jgi:hypothetical protein
MLKSGTEKKKDIRSRDAEDHMQTKAEICLIEHSVIRIEAISRLASSE